VTGLDHEQAAGLEVTAGGVDDPAHQGEAIGASRQRRNRFDLILGRQSTHHRGADVGGIRDDQVVVLRVQRSVEVRSDQTDACAQPVQIYIDPCYGKRIRRIVHCVDPGARECACKQNGEAPRARAQVKHPADAPAIAYPGCEAVVQEFRDE
jgi:hypothetical protein